MQLSERRFRARGWDLLTAASFGVGTCLSAWGFHLGWNVAPLEKTLRWSQKIFYFHAPLGIWSLVLILLGAVAGAVYLATRDDRADLACEAAMEVGLLGCAVVLLTGSLWAKPAWGHWFPYEDPRLASMLVLFLLGVAYRVVRSSVTERDRRARFSSVLAVLGAVNAIIVFYAIRIWDSTHPQVLGEGGGGMHEEMRRAFLWCLAATACLSWALLSSRYRLGTLRHAVDELARQVRDGGDD